MFTQEPRADGQKLRGNRERDGGPALANPIRTDVWTVTKKDERTEGWMQMGRI